jgi:hypothetical protein
MLNGMMPQGRRRPLQIYDVAVLGDAVIGEEVFAVAAAAPKKPANPPGKPSTAPQKPANPKPGSTNTPPTARNATYPRPFMVGTAALDIKAQDLLALLNATDADRGDKVDIISVTDTRTPSAVITSKGMVY